MGTSRSWKAGMNLDKGSPGTPGYPRKASSNTNARKGNLGGKGYGGESDPRRGSSNKPRDVSAGSKGKSGMKGY